MNYGNRMSIRLPEGVEFSLRLAGPITRFLAWMIDAVCINATVMIVSIIIGMLQVISLEFAGAMMILCYFIVTMGYSILLEWWLRGQTVGKRVMRIRVMDASGLRLTFGQVLIRNLLRFVDMAPALYMLGGLFCLFSPRSQRLGDLAANTIVVRQSEPVQPDLEKLMEGKFNSLRAHPHLAARLRQKVEPAQAALLLRALLRRDEMEAESRLQFFDKASGELRKLVPFPDDVMEALSDEAHVRNVVDVVYRPRVKA